MVLLKPESGAPIFCYCDACGCAWHKPEHAQFGYGLQYVKGPWDVSDSYIKLPSATEITEENLQPYVLAVINLSDNYSDIVEFENKKISEHRQVLEM